MWTATASPSCPCSKTTAMHDDDGPLIPCSQCRILAHEDDIIWSDADGNLDVMSDDSEPYCSYCLPEQPRYEDPR